MAVASERASRVRPTRPVEPVDFHRTKYGRELLVDVAWVREMPTFLEHGPTALSFYEIVLVTRGRGSFWLDADRYPVRAGTVFFTTPGQVRNWQVRDLDGLCLFFPALFLEEFFHDAAFLQRLPYFHVGRGAAALRLTPRASGWLLRHLRSMRRELARPRRDTAHLLRARLYEALVRLARQYAEVHRVPAERPWHPVALRYRGLVERFAPRRHGVAEFARELAVSPGHLNALSKRYLGRSAKGVIEDRLALLARRALLTSDESVARIGDALGFSDPSYFSRFFRRLTGRSPSRFRTDARP